MFFKNNKIENIKNIENKIDNLTKKLLKSTKDVINGKLKKRDSYLKLWMRKES